MNTLTQRLAEFKELLSEASDDRERLGTLIDLGKDLEKPSELSEPIGGCVSKAWINARLENNLMIYEGWAEALVVKGYVALLVEIFSGIPPQEIVQSDKEFETFVEETQLSVSLVPSRANAFEKLYQEIKKEAEKHL